MLPPRTSALAALTALVLQLPLTLTAVAADNAPPRPRDDAVTMYAGGTRLVPALRNDEDPDSDELQVCRLGDVSRGLTAGTAEALPDLDSPPYPEEAGKDLVVSAGPGTAGKNLTFTYYACDSTRLVPATVTVTVLRPRSTRVRALPRRPGWMQVRNVQDFKVDLTYTYRTGNEYFLHWRSVRPRQRVRLAVGTGATRVRWTISNLQRGYADRGRLRGL